MEKIKIKFTKANLYPIDTTKSDVDGFAILKESGAERIRATIPGNVELDMERAKILPNLFEGSNILELEKYELYDYWYELTFDCAKTKGANLCFEGIDTLSDIWLNGEKIGQTDNMFIPFTFDVQNVIKEKNNVLIVRIKSPVNYALDKNYDTAIWNTSYNVEGVYVRKAQHSYGWDICPRAIGGGIYKDVYLTYFNDTEIEDVYIHTLDIDFKGAHLRYSYDLKIDPKLFHNTYLTLDGIHKGKRFSVKQKIVFKHGIGDFCINTNNLALWNPVFYGEPNLYKVTAKVITENGEILAEKKFNLGVRTIKVDFSNGEEKKFKFIVNGVPVMIKGTNWVPLDIYHSRDNLRIDEALELLSDMKVNLVRCWGGNIYESEAFFDYCDTHGILVWQDLMMACNIYPSQDSFRDALDKELKSVITRIRKHTSLAIYCGDNECDLGMFFNGINPEWYKVTRDYVPSLLFRYDPFRRLLPSSPYFTSNVLESRNENDLAENHLWGPRNNFKSEFYCGNKNVFISEIGYHGCPSQESIKKFIPKKSIWPWENQDWMTHQTSPGGEWVSEWNRIKLMVYQVREMFGKEPENLDELVLCSQISQAEANKFFVENVRYNKWNKTGIIWWNMLDGWPQFSDAVVDYYFDKKLAYYYLKNVTADLCFMMKEQNGWNAELVIGNDGCTSYSGDYEIIDGLTGNIIKQGKFVSEKNQNVSVCEIPVSRNITAYYIFLLKTEKGNFVNHYVNFAGACKLEDYKKFLRRYAKYTEIPKKFIK